MGEYVDIVRFHPVGGSDPVRRDRTLAAMTSPVSVSAVVFSRNEADLLRDCLPRLTGFDRVLVCDMASTDDTVRVAHEHGAEVIAVPDVPVAEQVRQQALDALDTDWVLFVDADEHLPTGYRATLDPVIADPGIAGVRLRYDNVAFGRLLRHSLQGSAKYALVHRTRTRYSATVPAHRPPEFDGPAIDAPATVPPILHLNFRSIDQTQEKVLRYAASRADTTVRIDDPIALLREFARTTVFSGVWRDGRAGFAVAALHTVGQLSGSLIAAEHDGTLLADLPRRRTRLLGAIESTQRAAVRTRDALRRSRPR